jgi:NRPS condensation-like uncharacterized protein
MKTINISQIDTIFANGSYPIEFLLYYKDGLKAHDIRSALKSLSSVFWPVFGEYKAGTIHADTYHEADFFDEELIDQEFDKEEGNRKIYERFSRVNPFDLKKLFFLKVIQYSNGTVLIPKMNHLAADGYSYFFFLSALAELSKGIQDPVKSNSLASLYEPSHHRTILKEFRYKEIESKPLSVNEEFVIEFEEIPKTTVRSIIKSVASDFNHRVSGNDILSAMVIKKMAGIQKEYSKDDFQLTIPIDVRRQIKEYGMNYFGNGLMFNVTNFKKSDLEKLSINEIAIEIRKSMPDITNESYLEYLLSIETIIARKQSNKLKVYDPRSGCLVTNLSMLPANKLNFGTGDPAFIFPLTVGINSAAILSNRDNYILRLAY